MFPLLAPYEAAHDLVGASAGPEHLSRAKAAHAGRRSPIAQALSANRQSPSQFTDAATWDTHFHNLTHLTG